MKIFDWESKAETWHFSISLTISFRVGFIYHLPSMYDNHTFAIYLGPLCFAGGCVKMAEIKARSEAIGSGRIPVIS